MVKNDLDIYPFLKISLDIISLKNLNSLTYLFKVASLFVTIYSFFIVSVEFYGGYKDWMMEGYVAKLGNSKGKGYG